MLKRFTVITKRHYISSQPATYFVTSTKYDGITSSGIQGYHMKFITVLFITVISSIATASPMTKTDNHDGTVTYEQGGTRETVQKEQSKEIERHAKENGIEVKMVSK